jgi:hypothetical protein
MITLFLKKSSLFTSVLYNHYTGPKDFRFDELELTEPIVDDPESDYYNLDLKSK